MKINKAAMAALAVTLMAIGASAQAQDKPKSEGQPPPRSREQIEARSNRIATELKLTDEQKPKFEAVMKEANEKRRDMRQDTNLTPEQRREKMQAIQEDVKTKLKAILTAEQMTKYEEMMKQRPRGPGAPGAPGTPGEPKPGGEPKK